ncbi:hypothetical protein FRB90_004361, partial [Tulasnella sp. 427]
IVILQDGRYAGTPTTESQANAASSSGQHHPFLGAPPGSPTLGPSSPRRTWGPTPMNHDSSSHGPGQAQPGGESGALLPLPYHDRSSPYSEEQANSRARWRFFETEQQQQASLRPPSFALGTRYEHPVLPALDIKLASAASSIADEGTLAESLADSLNYQTFGSNPTSHSTTPSAVYSPLPSAPQQQLQDRILSTQHHQTQHLQLQQQPSHITHQHSSFQQQQQLNTNLGSSHFERSSYLDALSDSPSLSFLSPHPNNNSEPFGGNPLIRDHSKSFSLSPEDAPQYRGNMNGTAIQPIGRSAPRPGQNGLAPFDEAHVPPFSNHDIYSVHHPHQPPQHQPPPQGLPQSGIAGLDRFESEKSAFTLRQNSVIGGSGGPYANGSTLPESQQVPVNKVLLQQAQHLMQQQHQHQHQALQQQQQQQQPQQPQQFQAPNAAQNIFPNLPPNVNPRDYLLALQQLQNTQNLAAQLGGQIPNLNLQNLAANLAGANNSAPTSQEEISTIFVVGFPDDMQEREFQNMFTFCPGFEAATLKVPNKDLPAFGAPGNPNPAQAAAAAALQRAGIFPPSQPSFNGSTDPYNLLTTNSGGVVLDTANNGIWGGLGDDAYRALNLPPGTDLSGLAPPAPRKQIIGFAKFRSRQEALDAREVLQGRRVDMEKGSVLKAEMAKKNLHTKRGVGPTTTATTASTNQPNAGQINLLNEALVNLANINGLAGALQQQVQQQQLQQQHGLPNIGGDMLSPRDRESAALAAMGLPGLTSNRAVMDRDREAAREREKEREREMENQARARIGSVNLNAYDAFHSIPNGLPARPTTFPALPPAGSASLTPGITPALPASPSNQSSLYEGPRHPSAFNNVNGLGEAGHTLSNQPSFSSLGPAKESNFWPGPFGSSPVDPLDTSGAMGPGPSAAVGGPTSTNGLYPPTSGSLSRKPSSLHGLHNTSSPEQLAISASQSGAGSPINGSGIFEQQQSPAVPQGQPSAMNSPVKSAAQSASQSAFLMNGMVNGNSHSQGSSRNSAG